MAGSPARPSRGPWLIRRRRASGARVATWPVPVAVLVALPFLLVGLGGAAFDDPGEGMHAEIARELVVSRDPTVLTLNGVRYVDKPPLLYYLQALAFRLNGASEESARRVPAAAAAAAVAATAWLGARVLGAAGGLLAGLALLTCPLFFVYGRYVRPETLFVAALAAGFAWVLTGIAQERRWLAGLGLAAFGVAGLAKDPLGALLPPVVIALAFAACRRPALRWLPWPGLAACAVLGLGWWIVAEVRTPGALWYTVVDNKVLNVAGARVFPDEDVPLSAPEFLVVAALGAGPWFAGAAVAIADLLRRRAWRDPDEAPWVALALWALGVIGVTLLSQFRLPHYGLPAYPALALLAARAWLARGGRRGFAALHAALLAGLALACALLWLGDGARFEALVIGATDVATRKTSAVGQAAPFPAWDAMRPLVGQAAAALAAGAAVAGTAGLLAGRRRVAPLAPAGVLLAMLGLLPPAASAMARMSEHRAVRAVAEHVARHAGGDDVIVHEGPIEGSGAFEWYAGRRPVIVDGRRSVLAFGATRDDARDVFWDPARLRAAWTGGERRVWVVTTRAPERSLAAALPGARPVLVTPGRFLYASAPPAGRPQARAEP